MPLPPTPTRGTFILVFLLCVVGSSLTLFALRAPVVKSKVGFALWSRETLLLANNLILVVVPAPPSCSAPCTRWCSTR